LDGNFDLMKRNYEKEGGKAVFKEIPISV